MFAMLQTTGTVHYFDTRDASISPSYNSISIALRTFSTLETLWLELGLSLHHNART